MLTRSEVPTACAASPRLMALVEAALGFGGHIDGLFAQVVEFVGVGDKVEGVVGWQAKEKLERSEEVS